MSGYEEPEQRDLEADLDRWERDENDRWTEREIRDRFDDHAGLGERG